MVEERISADQFASRALGDDSGWTMGQHYLQFLLGDGALAFDETGQRLVVAAPGRLYGCFVRWARYAGWMAVGTESIDAMVARGQAEDVIAKAFRAAQEGGGGQ